MSDYFKYFPNQEIRSTTLYSKSEPTSIDDLVIEYDYLIRTNNFGLVMKRDVSPNEHAIFVIGDSFTEGQGVPNISWASTLQKVICERNYQAVNLGFPGIGVIDMKNSLKFAKDELKATKAVVSIITSDIYRPYLLLENNKKCSIFLKPN